MPSDEDGPGRLSTPLYDAIMVALDTLYDSRDALRARRSEVARSVRDALKKSENYEVFVGRPNTANAIKLRQDLAKSLLREHL